MTPVIALLLAWALDLCFGEPRSAWHPVAWLGSVLAPLGRVLTRGTAAWAFIGGALVWLVFASAIAWAAWAAQTQLLRLSPWFAAPLLALLLKPAFSWRMLRDEVAGVDAALAHSLEAGRARLSRIVSRDVNALDADSVRETAIESLAENLNDSLVAPLFWYALAGLPGAAVYRFANTLDAMWGYRGRWEWAGKWSAVADDVLSWLPARLTALLLRPSLRPGDWRALRAEARHTPSRFEPEKTLRRTPVRFDAPDGDWAALAGLAFDGCEIRCGRTEAEAGVAIVLRNDEGSPIGWQRGPVLGLYTHGLFESADAMRALFGTEVRPLDAVFDGLADFIDARFEPASLLRLIQGQE